MSKEWEHSDILLRFRRSMSVSCSGCLFTLLPASFTAGLRPVLCPQRLIVWLSDSSLRQDLKFIHRQLHSHLVFGEEAYLLGSGCFSLLSHNRPPVCFATPFGHMFHSTERRPSLHSPPSLFSSFSTLTVVYPILPALSNHADHDDKY